MYNIFLQALCASKLKCCSIGTTSMQWVEGGRIIMHIWGEVWWYNNTTPRWDAVGDSRGGTWAVWFGQRRPQTNELSA
jgi:hypothetical protein